MIQTYPVRYPILIAFITVIAYLFVMSLTHPTLHASASMGAQLRFVDEVGAPLANASLRLLCYDSPTDNSLNQDRLVETNATGALDERLPADCSYVAALRLIHQQPGGKDGRDTSYLVYDTSWQPGTRVTLPAQGDIFIRSQWRLVLFDVAIALEWASDSGSIDINQLREGMRNASAYLYDLSDGQMAFGTLTITSGGQNWESADIRIRAANDARPSARVGGIVGERTPFTTSTGIAITYAPGEILTGRSWDGDSAAIGDWSQAEGYRTLVHEWLHYALFLYDEYQQLGESGRTERYCTCDELPQLLQNTTLCGGETEAASAMAYHYTASELWRDGLPASCAESDQHHAHGGSDWQTLSRWGEIQGIDSEWLAMPQETTSGPQLGLVGDLFGSSPTPDSTENTIFLPLVSRSTQTQQLQSAQLEERSDLTMTVVISGGNLDLAALNQFQLQIYSIHEETAAQPMRIVHQGTTTGERQPPNRLGSVELLGVQPGDRLIVRADRYVRNGESFASLLYNAPLQAGQSTLSLVNNRWDGGLEVTPLLNNGRLDRLNLVLSTTLALPISPTVRLCSPDAAIGCDSGWQSTLRQGAAGDWQGTLNAANGESLPHYGILWLDAGDAGTLVRWFQAAGGVGPAHMFGEAPLRDGVVMVDVSKPLSATASAVLIMPADLQTLLRMPLPPGSNGLIGTPLDVQVATNGALPSLISTFFYNQETLQRLGLGDENTQLLRYDAETQRWQPVVGLSSSNALGWIASPAGKMGIYAVAWSEQPGIGRSPAMWVDSQIVRTGDTVRSTILLPANAAAAISATGTIRYTLPTRLTLLNPPHCSIGTCIYDEINRVVQWEGVFGEQRGVVLSLESLLEDSATCQPQLIHNAAVFDGLQNGNVNAVSQLDCTPTGTPVPTPLSTPTATSTVTFTITPSQTPTAKLTPAETIQP